MGVPASDIDHHRSDLYVRVTPLSKKWLELYKFKGIVTTFRSNLEPHDMWFDVPFGYMEEFIKEEEASMHRWAESIKARHEQH